MALPLLKLTWWAWERRDVMKEDESEKMFIMPLDAN